MLVVAAAWIVLVGADCILLLEGGQSPEALHPLHEGSKGNALHDCKLQGGQRLDYGACPLYLALVLFGLVAATHGNEGPTPVAVLAAADGGAGYGRIVVQSPSYEGHGLV